MRATVGQLIANLAARQRRAVVVSGDDLAGDLLAPVVDGPVGLHLELDRLDLILMHREGALVVFVFVVVAHEDAILALRSGGGQQEMGVEAAEGAQSDFLLQQVSAAVVEDLDRVLFAFLDGERVAVDLADDAAHVDHLARAIGGPVGIDVSPRRKPLRLADARQADHVRGDVSVDDAEHAHAVGLGQLLEGLVEHAVVAGYPLGEHLLAVGDEQLHAGPRLAAGHVFGKNERLIARAFHDQVQVALDDHRRRLERLAADRDRHHAGAGRIDALGRRQRDLDLVDALLVLLVVGHLELERGVGVDQCDVEPFDAAGQVHLAEIGLQVDRVDVDRDRLDVPRSEFDRRRLAATKDPLGRDRHALGGQSGDALPGRAGRRTPGQLLVFIERLFELAQLRFECPADVQLRGRRLLGLGVLRDQPAPIGDRLVPFLLGEIHLSQLQQDAPIPAVQRVLGQEGGPKLPGAAVVLPFQRVGRLEEFGVDDLALGLAPMMVRRVLAQVVGPGGQGVVELLLQLVRLAQHESGRRQLLAVGVARLGDQLEQRRDRVFIPSAMPIALGDPQVGFAGRFVFGIFFQEPAQCGHPQAQRLVALRLGDAVRERDVERRLGQTFRLRVRVQREQILPRAPCRGRVALGQL